MIKEIFVSDWDPVVPLPLMTAAQKDNELERIFELISTPDKERLKKRHIDQEFDRGFEAGVQSDNFSVMPENEKFWDQGFSKGYEVGYDDGYAHGRDGEARFQFDKSGP